MNNATFAVDDAWVVAMDDVVNLPLVYDVQEILVVHDVRAFRLHRIDELASRLDLDWV
jgi:hypothetical protein